MIRVYIENCIRDERATKTVPDRTAAETFLRSVLADIRTARPLTVWTTQGTHTGVADMMTGERVANFWVE